MEPQFAEAVDNVIVAALDLLERIPRNEAGSPEKERQTIRLLILEGDKKLNASGKQVAPLRDEWELARYALAGWIDARMIDAPWSGADWWVSRCLEWEFYQSAVAFEQFFLKAKEAEKFPRRNALEVYYLCVVFGFRGIYDQGERGQREITSPGELGLPSDVESWAQETYEKLVIGSGRPNIEGERERSGNCRPHTGRRTLAWSLAFSAVVIGACSAVILKDAISSFFSGL